MTLNEIRLYANTLLNKDEFGGELNMIEFNIALKEYNIEFFKGKVQSMYGAETGGALNFDLVYSSKMLRPFVVYDQVVVLTSGAVNILSSFPNFAYYLKAQTSNAYNGEIRLISLSNHAEVMYRNTNVLSVNMGEQPLAVMEENDVLRIFPSDIPDIDIAYLRFPVTPIFKYYINVNDDIVPIAEGGSHVLTTGEVGPNGEAAPTSISGTVELEFTVDLHAEFLNGLIGKLGLPNRDQVILQTTMVNEQKTDSK